VIVGSIEFELFGFPFLVELVVGLVIDGLG
jgi:hypothetical protein